MIKRVSIFFSLLFVCGIVSSQTVYQLPNPGFEQWDGGVESEPTHWNTFSSSDGSYSYLASSNHHYRRNGHRPGGDGNYFLTIYTKSIMGIKANGNMTTGRVHAGSMSATSSDNYNYTQRNNSDHCQPFTATPDSLYVWVSFYAEDADSKAQITAIIHGDSDFQSPNNDDNASLYKAIATVRTKRTTSSASQMTWKQLKVPFNYTGNSEASYILVNMTTNYQPGEGNKNDSLSVDDIEFIYSAWLSDLKFRGTTVDGFSKGRFDYTIHVDDINLLSTNDISYSTEVDDATVDVEVLQLDCDTAAELVVTVTAEDGITQKIYTILATTSLYVPILEAKEETFKIYPNPASDMIVIEGNAEVSVVDMLGRVVLSRKVQGNMNIDISGLPSGLYLVRDDKGNVKKIHVVH